VSGRQVFDEGEKRFQWGKGGGGGGGGGVFFVCLFWKNKYRGKKKKKKIKKFFFLFFCGGGGGFFFLGSEPFQEMVPPGGRSGPCRQKFFLRSGSIFGGCRKTKTRAFSIIDNGGGLEAQKVAKKNN